MPRMNAETRAKKQAQCVKLYAQGLSTLKIAPIVGLVHGTVNTLLIKAGVTMRTKWRQCKYGEKEGHKYCPECKDWLPRTPEFFYKGKKSGYYYGLCKQHNKQAAIARQYRLRRQKNQIIENRKRELITMDMKARSLLGQCTDFLSNVYPDHELIAEIRGFLSLDQKFKHLRQLVG